MRKHMQILSAFVCNEEGVALTEYLVLLAILLGGTLLAIAAVSQNISNAWNSWGGYYVVLGG